MDDVCMYVCNVRAIYEALVEVMVTHYAFLPGVAKGAASIFTNVCLTSPPSSDW